MKKIKRKRQYKNDEMVWVTIDSEIDIKPEFNYTFSQDYIKYSGPAKIIWFSSDYQRYKIKLPIKVKNVTSIGEILIDETHCSWHAIKKI